MNLPDEEADAPAFGESAEGPSKPARKSLAERGPGWIVAMIARVFLYNMAIFPKYNSRAMFSVGYFAVAVASAIVVWDLRTRPGSLARRVTEWGPLVKLGRISYGVYLWHYPILQVLVAVRKRMGRRGGLEGCPVRRRGAGDLLCCGIVLPLCGNAVPAV